MRRVASLLLPLVVLAAPARAQPAPDIGAALRAGRWTGAAAAADTARDPLAAELVRFYRLLTPLGGGSAEIAAFMADHPNWPLQAQLARRLADALALDHDDHGVMTVCARPGTPATLRCAELPRTAPDPAADARRAWLAGGFTDPLGETAFLNRYGRSLTPDEQWARFNHLVWIDNGAPGGPAARQAARLDPARRVLAQARLQYRRDDPAAGPASTAAEAADPGLMLDEARWFRRANADTAALALWERAGAAAEAAAPPERRAAFWDERNLLARRLLRAGNAPGAYALAAGYAQPGGEPALDSAFLAGWIALRRLDRPADALPHFTRLLGLSRAVITQARGHYWVARTHEAAGDADAAHAEYEAAAGFPTTFYGQLAAAALGDLPARLRALSDPAWDTADIALIAGHDLARAALLLETWGESRRGRLFLARLEEIAPEPRFRALAARLADALAWSDAAVAAARRAGRDGIMLPRAGWPTPFTPPANTVDPAFALAIMRQESSFDPDAASPVGARGLMQLMPATAAAVARRTGDDAGSLTDPATNMRLGTAYLAQLMAQWSSMPLAAAAYNAGPSRVADWLAANGDPRGSGATTDPAALADWIELIPFNETRNYVQRVMENFAIYHAALSDPPR